MVTVPVLYFDLGSPYAYLTAERAEDVLGIAPRFEPVALGAIFRMRGSGSWARTDARAAHVEEIEQRAAAYGLPPVRWPERWPPENLDAMRAATWARRHGRAQEFGLAALRRAFVHGEVVQEHATLQAAAADADLPAEDLPAVLGEQWVKDALREATDGAWDIGVRGVPTVSVGGELFYGDDRLEDAAAALRG